MIKEIFNYGKTAFNKLKLTMSMPNKGKQI